MQDNPVFRAIENSSEIYWLRICRDTNKDRNPAVAEAAAKRLVEVEVAAALKQHLGGDTIESRVAESIRVYREYLKLKHGRTQAAGYAERDIKKLGAKDCVIKTVKSAKAIDGLKALLECGRLDCSYEQIAIDFADAMPAEVVAQAHKSLSELNTP